MFTAAGSLGQHFAEGQDAVNVNKFEMVGYRGWPQCYRLSNGEIEILVTGDVGPRVIHLGFIGQQNEFFEQPDALGKTGGDEWRMYGGHRLWHAPEHPVRTYFPDNQPVTCEQQEGIVRVNQPTEPTTMLQKRLIFPGWMAGCELCIASPITVSGQ